MAGRSASSWAKFDDATKYDAANNKWVKSYAHKVADPTTINTDRYSAVNTNTRATLEMRIFKGSINTTNVRGALGLAHASVEYTRTMSLQEVKDGGLTTAKFIDYINSNSIENIKSDIEKLPKVFNTYLKSVKLDSIDKEKAHKIKEPIAMTLSEDDTVENGMEKFRYSLENLALDPDSLRVIRWITRG
jgi:hypothetical protein